MGYVYRITNTVNQKHYIGISIHEPEKGRIRDHLSGNGNRILAGDINKYGRNAFTYEILEENVFPGLLPDLEIDYIAKYNTVRPNGYNLSHGGEGGGSPSEETRKRIGAAHRGRIHSKETREKLSLALRGHPVSKETREKIGATGRGRIHSKETREKIGAAHRGRIHSKETREKISLAHRGKVFSSEHRRNLSKAHKGKKRPSHSEEHRRKLSEVHKNSPRAIEARRKLREAMLSPECKAAYELYLSFPLDMDISEKRKLLREKFPDINRKNIERWVRKWQSQPGS